ncbi:lasso peptide biosynthesis B2 protein [Streptomyces luteireticuli]|uniref:lasso peptide biosynthesis B2 protein n=1 Tax=Streptomyces luteireticuli TaxID=173858 RepID=UPI003558C746
MSVPFSPEDRPALALHHRIAPLTTATLARALARLSPRNIRRILQLARLGAAPATIDQALAARQDIIAVSARCAGEHCLQRSLATVLLCRTRGVWPTWRSGVRGEPFRAHAWIEVDGQPIGEPPSTALYHPIITIAHPLRVDRRCPGPSTGTG